MFFFRFFFADAPVTALRRLTPRQNIYTYIRIKLNTMDFHTFSTNSVKESVPDDHPT